MKGEHKQTCPGCAAPHPHIPKYRRIELLLGFNKVKKKILLFTMQNDVCQPLDFLRTCTLTHSHAHALYDAAGIQKILEGVLANSAGMATASGTAAGDIPAAKVMNNLDWFGSMGFLEFLREIGKYARVGRAALSTHVFTQT